MSRFYCSAASCPRRWKTFRAKGERATCRSCHSKATELKAVPDGARSFIRPEFFEYFDMSLGRPITSRSHKRQVQKELGAQDWEPVKEGLHTERMKRAGLL